MLEHRPGMSVPLVDSAFHHIPEFRRVPGKRIRDVQLHPLITLVTTQQDPRENVERPKYAQNARSSPTAPDDDEEGALVVPPRGFANALQKLVLAHPREQRENKVSRRIGDCVF